MKSVKMQKLFFILLLLVIFYCAPSCSRSEPRIAFGFIELVYFQDKDKPQERFSFFIIPEDDEGIENLEELLLYHDREQLLWQLKSSDWISYTEGEKTWIGSRNIVIGEDEHLPRGQFRAVLVNKGGERSERNFSFDAPEEPRFPFPDLQISEGRYTVRSSYPVNRFVCYDQAGAYHSTINLNTLSGTIDSLNLSSNVISAALWAEDSQYFTSAYTDAVAVR